MTLHHAGFDVLMNRRNISQVGKLNDGTVSVHCMLAWQD